MRGMELAFAVSRSHAENPQEMAGREIAVIEIAGILSRLCKERVWPCVVLAAMVHEQGLHREVVTVLAWGCRILTYVDGFVTPEKPINRKQLAFGKSGGGGTHAPPDYCSRMQTMYFLGTSAEEQLWFTVEA